MLKLNNSNKKAGAFMRVIKNYFFSIGTKVPFSELPEIVSLFLEENNLTSNTFMYYFEDLPACNITSEYIQKKSSCSKILKDCPSLGEIRLHKGSRYGRFDKLWISNIDKEKSFASETILPLMKKIHRRYGLSECDLYYFDINFFEKRTSFERNYRAAEDLCEEGFAFDKTVQIEDQPYGSGIRLHRDILADNYLSLSVDILHNGKIMDATPYYDSLQKLLPKIKSDSSVTVYLTEEEKKKYEKYSEAATSLLDKCRSFFSERLTDKEEQNTFESNYSIAKPMKKLSKQFGYSYEFTGYGSYASEKRTEKGNIIYIDVDSGPSHYDLNVQITYQGLGFFHGLGGAMLTPTNQQEADECLNNVFAAVSDLESTFIASLDLIFPETPSWFIPSPIP